MPNALNSTTKEIKLFHSGNQNNNKHISPWENMISTIIRINKIKHIFFLSFYITTDIVVASAILQTKIYKQSWTQLTFIIEKFFSYNSLANYFFKCIISVNENIIQRNMAYLIHICCPWRYYKHTHCSLLKYKSIDQYYLFNFYR